MEYSFTEYPVTHLRKKETQTCFNAFKSLEKEYGVELKYYCSSICKM